MVPCLLRDFNGSVDERPCHDAQADDVRLLAIERPLDVAG